MSPQTIAKSKLTSWQGTKDVPYGTTVPAEQIKLFTNAKSTKLDTIEGGGHYLNATNPAETEKALIAMITNSG